jgi:hypothetical protein
MSQGGNLVSDADLSDQAIRVSQRLREVWTEDLPNEYPDLALEEILGLALAHALDQGWVEPDPTMLRYLDAAEALLEAGSDGE